MRTAIGKVKACDWCGARRVVVFEGDVVIRGVASIARLCSPCVRRDGVELRVSDDAFTTTVQGALFS